MAYEINPLDWKKDNSGIHRASSLDGFAFEVRPARDSNWAMFVTHPVTEDKHAGNYVFADTAKHTAQTMHEERVKKWVTKTP